MEKFWMITEGSENIHETDGLFDTENVALAEAKRLAQDNVGMKIYVMEAVAEVVGKVETEVKKLS